MNIAPEAKNDALPGAGSVPGRPALAGVNNGGRSEFSASLESQQKRIDQRQESQRQTAPGEPTREQEQKLPDEGKKLPVAGSADQRSTKAQSISDSSGESASGDPSLTKDQVSLEDNTEIMKDSADELPLVGLLAQSYELTAGKPQVTGAEQGAVPIEIEGETLDLTGNLATQPNVITPLALVGEKSGPLTDLSELYDVPEGIQVLPVPVVENLSVDIVTRQGGTLVLNAPLSGELKQMLTQLDGEASLKGTAPENLLTSKGTVLNSSERNELGNFSPKLNLSIQAAGESIGRQDFITTIGNTDNTMLELSKNFASVGGLATDVDATQQLRTLAQQISPSNPVSTAQVTGEVANPSRTFLMNTPLGEPGWEQEIGSRVRWMVGQDQQVAELKLNPPHLGVLEVRITTDEEKTKVTFFAQNPNTKELMEGNMPRLRDLLASAGIDLGDTEISYQSFSDRDENGRMANSEPNLQSGSGLETEEIDLAKTPMMMELSKQSNGLVDTFI